MGRDVLIGHGGFDKKSEMVLGPMGTSITFLADAGSRLKLPSVPTLPPGKKPADGIWKAGVNCRFDYEKVANLLDSYLQAETARRFTEPVTNMFVKPVDAESLQVAKELAAQDKWGGERKWNEGGAGYLCTGDASTCRRPRPASKCTPPAP